MKNDSKQLKPSKPIPKNPNPNKPKPIYNPNNPIRRDYPENPNTTKR